MPSRVIAARPLPSALDSLRVIADRLHARRPAVFLDYDGTLTPIVDKPDLAKLSQTMRAAVARLAELCPVAVISGRDRLNVQRLVRLHNVAYAGSHGFDIVGPSGKGIAYQHGSHILPVLDKVERELRLTLSPLRGTFVERKRYTIAVHYRGADPPDQGEVDEVVDAALARHPTLRKGWGKKVFELQPRLDWNKGKAVAWLLRALGLEDVDVLPVYIGDDQTDEDAFELLGPRGLCIVVLNAARPTAATYALRDPAEVERFLQFFCGELES